ncbi:MAG: ABC transporter permease, partial [Flavobacteriales bacterium]
NYSFVLEEKVLIEHKEKQIISEIKGVDENYHKLVDTDSIIKAGEYFSDKLYRDKNVMVLGAGIAYSLSVDINNMFSQLTVTFPNRNSKYIKDASDLVSSVFTPIGVFSVQVEYDNKYVLIPLNRAQKMLQREGEASSAEINIKDSDNMNQIKIDLEQTLGEDFVVKSRLEQHEFLYKLLNSEKLAVFLILVFILIIASFNIISSLSMLMIDKKNDIKTFWNLGSSEKQIRNIFFTKGFFGVLLGSCIGIGIGVSFSLLQQYFGFISMQGNFVVSAYPIKLLFSDILTVELTVVIIGLIASYYPAKILTSKFLKRNNS